MTRMRSAAVRYRDASERDERASRRDRTALERDEAAACRDLVAGANGAAEEMATQDDARARAAEDRERAGRDRDEAAQDREQARQDRELLMLEVERSHIDEASGAYRRQIGEVFLRQEIERARRAKHPLVLGLITTRAAIQTGKYAEDATQAALFRDLFLILRMKLRPFDPNCSLGVGRACLRHRPGRPGDGPKLDRGSLFPDSRAPSPCVDRGWHCA